jgi:hypothetical protein
MKLKMTTKKIKIKETIKKVDNKKIIESIVLKPKENKVESSINILFKSF